MATLQWSLTATNKSPDYLLEEYSAPLCNGPGRPLLYMAISHSKSTKPGYEHDWYSLHLCLVPTHDSEDHSNNLFLGEVDGLASSAADSMEELQALAEEQRKFLASVLQG